MTGVFDRLQKRMELEAKSEGISPLDLADLPPLLRKVMRHMLREVEQTSAEINEWAADLPGAERPTPQELNQALETLSKQFWLIKRGEGETITYQANLRRKAGSKIPLGVWNVLDGKIAPPPEKKEPGQE